MKCRYACQLKQIAEMLSRAVRTHVALDVGFLWQCIRQWHAKAYRGVKDVTEWGIEHRNRTDSAGYNMSVCQCLRGIVDRATEQRGC
jgi:hypothetical protein